MKKIKIMLLSLALLAVVGGALAFKAKMGPFTFCTAPAFFDQLLSPQYYCSFEVDVNNTMTKDCEDFKTNITTTNIGVQKVCTTVPPTGVDTPQECTTLDCPNTTSTKAD